jgi:hypothetical protein
MTPCQFQKFAPATADVQPFSRSRFYSAGLEKFLNQKPLSPMKMDRVACESISEGVVEQLVVGGCKLVEFRRFPVNCFQGAASFVRSSRLGGTHRHFSLKYLQRILNSRVPGDELKPVSPKWSIFKSKNDLFSFFRND